MKSTFIDRIAKPGKLGKKTKGVKRKKIE